MDAISNFLRDNMIAVFFVYGLAFFVMGLAIALESRRSSALALASSLKYLAAFGLLHGIVEWMDMFLLIQAHGPEAVESFPLRVVKVLLMAISTVCLVQFGANLITTTLQKHLWLRWLPPGLFAIWLLSFVIPHLYWVPSEGRAEVTSLCLQCHWGQSAAYLAISKEWLTSADIWARYLLYLPGSVLAALAILTQRPVFRGLGLTRITSDCSWATAAFALNAFVAGLIVPPASYFPASVLNYASFFSWTHVPPQVFRAFSAFAILYFIVRILSLFEIQHQRQLEEANRQRFEAQQQALETQRRAQQETEQWSRQLEERVRQRTSEIEALYRIATEISALLEIDKILESVVKKARQLLATDVAALSLVDHQTGELVVRAVSGAQTQSFGQIRLRPGQGLAGRAVSSGQPVVVQDYAAAPSITHELDEMIKAEGLQSHLAVPLKMREKTLGALYVADRKARSFSQADVQLATRLASQASIAIENARLYDQVQNLAILEERDRIAREMHDSLAQALGYLGLKAETVAQLLAAGQIPQAEAQLSQMAKAADDAYADVRESILGLRTAASHGRQLIPSLKEYLRNFSFQNRVEAELVVGDGVPARFPPAVEIQLVRIIQEALTNVRKHAEASQVWVRFEANGDKITATVEDNGRGFLRSVVRGGQHFGLQTMQERAESVGGTLRIESSPGSGTKVVVSLPRDSQGGR